MIYTDYKNYVFPKGLKGFKIFITPTIQTFKIYSNSRIIEISRSFDDNLNGYQKYFLMVYCMKFYKLKSVEKATYAAFDIYKFNGLPEADILDLLDRINDNKKLQKFVSFYILQWLSLHKIKLSIYKLLNYLKNGIPLF